MTHTLNTTVALEALGEPAQCPTLDQVRGQEVWFYPRHWLARWPQGLEIPPFLRQDDDVDVRRAVTRDDLFALAVRGISTPSEAVNFYTAVWAGELVPTFEGLPGWSVHFGTRWRRTIFWRAWLRL